MYVPYRQINEQPFKSKGDLPGDDKLVQTRIMQTRTLLCCLSLLALTAQGCTQFPELDAVETPDLQGANYPPLVPIEPILAEIDTQSIDTESAAAQAEARVARLRARANTLRRAGLTDKEEERLRQGLR